MTLAVGGKSRIILGIDPGTRMMGFSVLQVQKTGLYRPKVLCLEMGLLKPKATLALEKRLQVMFRDLAEIAREYQPQILAIEKAFMGKNVKSAMHLGMSRACAMLAVETGQVVEISPNEIKKTVTGFGHASKQQVCSMLGQILGVKSFPSYDVSDALAVAYTASLLVR